MTINFNEVWTAPRVNRLTELWAAGMSCADIACDLGGGISRNGVIGKIHRLKLPDPAGKRIPKQHQVRPTRPEPRPFLAPPPATHLRNGHDPSQRRNPSHNIVAAIAIAGTEPGLPERLKGEVPDGTGIKFLQLTEATCKWPKGDPREEDFEFCGGRALEGMPYCSHHCRLAYLPTQSRNRAMQKIGG